MTAGYVDRTLLASNYQNPGDVYDDSKTEGAFKVLADQNDANWDYIGALVAGGTLQPYPAFLSRQALINGNFDVAQRGTSFTNPTNAKYTLDRWQVSYASSGTLPANIIHSQIALNPGDIPGAYFGYRVNPDGAGSPATGDVYQVRQQIENGTRYLCGTGKKVTVSFWAKSNLSGKKLGVRLIQFYGSGGSPNGGEVISGNFFTLTSNWAKYSITFTTNTLVGKTFGTNNDDTLAINIAYMWGASLASQFGDTIQETFRGGGLIDIAQVQINAGDQALPFQPRSFAEELALCQRYFEKSYDYSVVPGTANTNGVFILYLSNIQNGYFIGSVPFKVRKRIYGATAIIYSPTDGSANVYNIGGSNTPASIVAGESALKVSQNNVSTNSGNAQFHWTVDAEL